MIPAESYLFDMLNRGVQTVLSIDSDTSRAFGKLNGKVYCIELTLPSVTLYMVAEPEGFSLAPQTEREPDVTLKGSIFAFASLSGKSPANGVLTDGRVTMQGDAEAGQALQKILAQFDFDWEELIARLIGDTPARKVGNLIRSTFDWAEHSANLSRANFADYLTEEKRIVINDVALERFAAKVDRLRADTDRLALRIERIRQGN